MYRIFEIDDLKEIKGLTGEYIVQEKYDGMRIQLHKFNNKVKIYSFNEKILPINVLNKLRLLKRNHSMIVY